MTESGHDPTVSSSLDILLISLQIDLDTIGLKSLHATLLTSGFSSSILYLPGLLPGDHMLMKTALSFFRRIRPRVVGISLMSHEYSAAAALTGHIRQAAIEIPVVWGGIHPTIAPEMCLEHADFVCVGEGESSLVQFLEEIKKGCDTNNICGFQTREKGLLTNTPPSPRIKNLDRLPFTGHIPQHSFIGHNNRILPLDKVLFKKYARWKGTVYSFMASRGCAYACAYCCNEMLTRMYGSKVIRHRRVDSIIAELEAAIEGYPDIAYINFQDDCFLACSDAYLTAFCIAYQERIHRPFIVRCIPSFITEQRLRQLKAAGLSWISMGLQSGSDHVLMDIYNRRSLSKDFLKAAKIISKVNVAAYYDVILDNPLETDGERLETVDILTAVPRPYFLQMFSLVLYPGTSLYRRLVSQHGRHNDDYLIRNYHDYRKTDLNRLIRISGYLPLPMIRRLRALYAKNGSTPRFRLLLRLAELISAVWFEPLTYLRVVFRGAQGNMSRFLRLMPAFFRIGVSRYIKQFDGKAVKRIERMIRDNSSQNR